MILKHWELCDTYPVFFSLKATELEMSPFYLIRLSGMALKNNLILNSPLTPNAVHFASLVQNWSCETKKD